MAICSTRWKRNGPRQVISTGAACAESVPSAASLPAATAAPPPWAVPGGRTHVQVHPLDVFKLELLDAADIRSFLVPRSEVPGGAKA